MPKEDSGWAAQRCAGHGRGSPSASHQVGAQCSPREERGFFCGFYAAGNPRWGDFTRSHPQPLAFAQMLVSTNPPKHLMSFETAIVLTKLIETGQGVQGLGGEGGAEADRVTPEALSGRHSK